MLHSLKIVHVTKVYRPFTFVGFLDSKLLSIFQVTTLHVFNSLSLSVGTIGKYHTLSLSICTATLTVSLIFDSLSGLYAGIALNRAVVAGAGFDWCIICCQLMEGLTVFLLTFMILV